MLLRQANKYGNNNNLTTQCTAMYCVTKYPFSPTEDFHGLSLTHSSGTCSYFKIKNNLFAPRTFQFYFNFEIPTQLRPPNDLPWGGYEYFLENCTQ